MNDTQKAKIVRFMNDKVMSEAVYTIIQEAFLEPYSPKADVNLLAASRIALDMLPEAWKRLNQITATTSGKESSPENPGL